MEFRIDVKDDSVLESIIELGIVVIPKASINNDFLQDLSVYKELMMYSPLRSGKKVLRLFARIKKMEMSEDDGLLIEFLKASVRRATSDEDVNAGIEKKESNEKQEYSRIISNLQAKRKSRWGGH